MIARGFLAGAAGIVALDAVSYLDMLVRGRPASELPGSTVQKLATKFHVRPLAHDDGDAPKNRRSGAGAILGYGVGFGSAIAYSTIRPAVEDWLPWPVAGAILGIATLVTSEGSATAVGATDWATWSFGDWIADLVPRTVFGLAVAYVCEILDEED